MPRKGATPAARKSSPDPHTGSTMLLWAPQMCYNTRRSNEI